MRALARRASRGFTLIELMLALLLLGVVTVGIYRVLVSNQRTYHAQTQRIRLQQNIRAAAAILPAELREIAASERDVHSISATEIRMRGIRQFGVMCVEPVLGNLLTDLPITLFQNLYSGPPLEPGDSLLVYYEGDELSRLDDQWWRADVQSVVGNALCPDGVTPGVAYRINLSGTPGGTILNRVGAIPRGGPIRGFQAVRYALYQAATDNLWYLGLQVDTGALEPIVGPLSGSTGLTFIYFDRGGSGTTVPDSVALVEIRVRGRTAAPIQREGGGLYIPLDSLVTRAAMRNNRRF